MITVDGAELRATLLLLRKLATKAAKEQLVLIAKPRSLEFRFGGMTSAITATGAWLGEIRVAARPLLMLPKTLPLEGPVELVVDTQQRRLRIGTLSISCEWQPTGGKKIVLPMDPSPLLLLRIAVDESAEDIERSGLSKLVAEAWAEVEELTKHAEGLLAPFGVRDGDLKPIVADGIRRITRSLYPLPK